MLLCRRNMRLSGVWESLMPGCTLEASSNNSMNGVFLLVVILVLVVVLPTPDRKAA